MKGVSVCESSHIASSLPLVTMQQPWSRSVGGNWSTGKACSNQPVYSFGETLPKCVGFDKKKTIELMYSLMKIDLVALIIF